MSRVGGSRPHKTTTTRRREKREERRAKSEERRKKRKETPKEAAKGPQMRPPEGGQPFSRPSRPLMGPLAASRAEGREQRKERREKKKEKTRFFCFSLSAEGVFPKDRVSLFPSRWLAVAASEGKTLRSLATRPSKTFFFKGKQAFLQKRSFASKDGWDRVLRLLLDVLGPLRRGQGEQVHASKKLVSKAS